jgi:SAM-dependent methyltransferase
MKCWCGCGDLVRSFHPDYWICSKCETFVSKKGANPVELYTKDYYWDVHQKEMGFPNIEGRSVSDFKDRIPIWYESLKGSPGRMSILEIGCGHGGFLSYCIHHGFSRVVGVEIDPKVCSYAMNRFRHIEILSGVFPNVAISGTFDYVVGFDVLEHFPNPVESLLTMRKLMNPHGRVVIQTPWYRGEGNGFVHFHGEEHLFIYTEESVRKLFTKCGFRITHFKQGVFHQDMTITGANHE